MKKNYFEFPSVLRSLMAEISGDNRLKEPPIASSTASDCRLFVPIARHYQPELAALEQLVDVLYDLLTDAAVTESVTATARSEPTCVSGAPE